MKDIVLKFSRLGRLDDGLLKPPEYCKQPCRQIERENFERDYTFFLDVFIPSWLRILIAYDPYENLLTINQLVNNESSNDPRGFSCYLNDCNQYEFYIDDQGPVDFIKENEILIIKTAMSALGYLQSTALDIAVQIDRMFVEKEETDEV